MIAQHGSLQAFKDTFCPAGMTTVAKDPGRAYNGTAPTLEVVMLAFGVDAVTAWLYTFIDYFVQYCGKGSLSSMQMMDVARRMSAKSFLKVTEFMLFFWRLGNADYGRIYGTIDPLFIMDSFNKFLNQRDKELGEYAVTITDDVAESNEPKITPREYYFMARNGELDQDVAEIALKVLGPYS